MTSEQSADAFGAENDSEKDTGRRLAERPLRLWPGLLIPILVLAAVFLPGKIVPGTMVQFVCMMAGPLIGAILFLLWWLFASRAPWLDRLSILALFVASATGVAFVAHVSMPIGLYLFGWPAVAIVFTGWLYVSRKLAWPARRLGVWLAVLLGWSFWTLLRCDGLDGAVIPDLSWRWSRSAEERYLDWLKDPSPPEVDDRPLSAPLTAAAGDWPSFRGPRRDGRVDHVHIDTDWQNNPPRELWRRPIGPGWSSFAAVGDRLFTQEQRGDDEVVLCLDAATGDENWAHRSTTRFWEVVGGAGPRATPTFFQGKIYAFGANGTLVCLDAASGDLCWSREVVSDGNASVPMWGFASSPLVVDERVIVFAGGGKDNSVLAYEAGTGELVWSSGNGTHSYSSPQIVEFAGAPQVLMMTEQGVASLSPANGDVLWEHDWPMPGYRVVQPNVFEDSILIGTSNSMGTRRISVGRSDGRWIVDEMWTSRGLKPYFNDFVIHDGHVYGLDNNILACLDLANGERRWKGGRYGTGQILLLSEQDLLLVSTEKTGEVVLAEASPTGHSEVARCKVLTGKTWNHPVIAHGRLFVRNGKEAACFELDLLQADQTAVLQ